MSRSVVFAPIKALMKGKIGGGDDHHGQPSHPPSQRSRLPLVCFDVLVEVLDHLTVVQLRCLVGCSRTIWRICSRHLVHWRWAFRPRFVQSIAFTNESELIDSKEGPVHHPGCEETEQMTMVFVLVGGGKSTLTVSLHNTSRKHPGQPGKLLRRSRLPLCPPPSSSVSAFEGPSFLTGFGRLLIELPYDIQNVEVFHFLMMLADQFANHRMVFDEGMTFAGCCQDTVPTLQLINVFSKRGLGALKLTLEPRRFEKCSGTRRSLDLRDWLRGKSPGLLDSPTVLRTPVVWIRLRPPHDSAQHQHPSAFARLSHFAVVHVSRLHRLPSSYSRFALQHSADGVHIQRDRQKSIKKKTSEVKLFRRRLIAETLHWLNCGFEEEFDDQPKRRVFVRRLHFDAASTECRLSLSNIAKFIGTVVKHFMREDGSTTALHEQQVPVASSWAIIFHLAAIQQEEEMSQLLKPFRVENPSIGECLSLYWHRSRLQQQQREDAQQHHQLEEQQGSSTSSCSPSVLILRRHPIYGPLAPFDPDHDNEDGIVDQEDEDDRKGSTAVAGEELFTEGTNSNKKERIISVRRRLVLQEQPRWVYERFEFYCLVN